MLTSQKTRMYLSTFFLSMTPTGDFPNLKFISHIPAAERSWVKCIQTIKNQAGN